MKLLDLFAGRLGWSRAFLDRGWEVVAYDQNLPDIHIPDGVDYRLQDILTLTPEDIRAINPDFTSTEASSPCEQFSVHGMRCFHKNPPYPELGIRLFNHARMLCESSGVPYIQENVRSAENFKARRAYAHCGPFYLWGTGVPPLLPRGIKKGMKLGGSGFAQMTPEQRRLARKQDPMQQSSSKSKLRKMHSAMLQLSRLNYPHAWPTMLNASPRRSQWHEHH